MIERHPGYDRYPPANRAGRRPVPPRDEPEVPEFLTRRTPPGRDEPPPDPRGNPPRAAGGEPPREPEGRTSRWARRRHEKSEARREHDARGGDEVRGRDAPQANPPTRPYRTGSTEDGSSEPREWQQPHDFGTRRRVRYDPESGHESKHSHGDEPAPRRAPERTLPYDTERTRPYESGTPPFGPAPQSARDADRTRSYDAESTRPDATRPAHDPAAHPESTQPQPFAQQPETHDTGGVHKPPRKLTVTRVAARRSIELTQSGFATFQRAAKADGAEESGLTALVYATMANFATDAAIAVALANTLFFASATAESVTKVALYLVITIAPFAVIAPVIGPMLDRLQHGRRIALAGSFAIRVLVAGLLIFNIDNWALYPLALCMMVLSKSFSVLKSAVTPRVLPPGIDLVRTNSRLTVFGLVGGTLCAGGVAALIAKVTGSTGALLFAAALAAAGAFLSLRIPSWVENTEGEVPATLGYHGDDARTEILDPSRADQVAPTKRRQPLGRSVVTGLWGNSTVRVLTGFLTFYAAFVVKTTEHRGVQQIAMLAVVGVAAAVGNFAGNATGARMKLGRPQLIVLVCTVACVGIAIAAAVLDSLMGAALATLVASGASALAKVSLDAAIQDDLPPESVASGFGRSETVLQLAWVLGGALGVLLPTLWMPTMWWKGFAVVSVVMALGLIQTVVSYRGHSLLPGLGGNRPQHAKQEVPGAHHAGEPTP
ncbi:MFS transporter [Nocardia sp. ET3-3]|uniref:MFS transporter n=1 Tax=Nocardia terrae TaxID=2675851 RepID=A0A7K1UYB4_9NOCA|nr:MFS transporter [Nocardia terrae]MVU79179.1 MFS transporter [Nocardia terrae]